MLFTAAGGPTKDAEMKKLKLERAGKTLWEGDEFRRAIAEGRTLEDLRVQAGGQLKVPSNKHPDLFSPIPVIAGLVSIPVQVYTLTHLQEPRGRPPGVGPGGLAGGSFRSEQNCH